MATVNRREQVSELIKTGLYTKAEIAAKLEVNAASVSSQMTYLRWMGNFIIADENKKLSFCTEEEAQAVAIAAQSNKKAAESKDPQARANALAKTIATQTKQLTAAQAKLNKVNADLAEEPEDEVLIELQAEAAAHVTLLSIKVKRNVAAAAELPEPQEVVETPADPDTEGSDDTDGTDGTDDDLL